MCCAPDEAGELPSFEPVYPLTAGVTQRLVAKAAQGALTRAPELAEWIDGPLLQREGWPAWKAAIMAVHAPQSAADIAPTRSGTATAGL